MRILMASYGPLDVRGGAAQILLELASTLRERGHDVTTLGTKPAPPHVPVWRHRAWAVADVEAVIQRAGPFDVIEVSPTLTSARIERSGLLVVRDVQPELGYLAVEARAAARAFSASPRRAAASLVLLGMRWGWIRSGWRRARLIFCLGSLGFDGMARRYPSWRPKLAHYLIAPRPDERASLRAVRAARQAAGAAVRFLWIGRWSPHKGTEAMLEFARARLATRGADTLTIAGTGIEPDLGDLSAAGARVRVERSFERAALPALLGSHDVGLFTSCVEGWGLSLQEMLESGLPVLATPAGAVRDLEPYFPALLQRFPPSPEWRPPVPGVPPGAGYDERFDWKVIAREYEETVSAAASGRG